MRIKSGGCLGTRQGLRSEPTSGLNDAADLA